MIKFEIAEGYEVRGEVIRLYPTREQEQRLEQLQQSLKTCWNWLCKQTQEVIDARSAYAVKQGLVGPPLVRPNYDGMEPVESKAVAETHREACREWHRRVYETTNKLDCCSWRPKLKEMIAMYSCPERPLKQDYQLLREVVLNVREWHPDYTGPIPSAHLLQALVHNYFSSGRAADNKGRAKGQHRKKFRRRDEEMPLQVRSGDCFRVGDFTPKYERPGQHRSFDCQVSFEGMKFPGKLPGRKPTGRVLEGVTIKHLPDGWYASIKQVVPVRVLPDAVPGSIVGINGGLDCIAALTLVSRDDLGKPYDDRHYADFIVPNSRRHALSREIAKRQAEGKPVGRLHQKMKRVTMHVVYNGIVKPLARAETIICESSSSNVGFLPHGWDDKASQQKSVMRTITRILTERFGERVREVQCFDESVTCSRSGKKDEKSWAYNPEQRCKCACCQLEWNRDVNAARNMAAKCLEIQDAAE